MAGRVPALAYVFSRPVARRSATIAAVVGVLLSTINQADVLWHGPFTAVLALKLVLNFVVPFTVASVSAAANRPSDAPSTEGRAPD